MIRIVSAAKTNLNDLRNPQLQADNEVEKSVSSILANVRERGDEALIEYTKKFDRVDIESIEVTKEEIDQAYASVDPELIRTMEQAAQNIEAYHRKQLRDGYRMEKDKGIVLGQRVLPLARVGVYAPGGTASYPSTVLMDIIPAKIAGVNEIYLTTPPDNGGKVAPERLAAAKIAGATSVFRVGGAQAIAALAYGTQTVPAVDKVVGPGNIYVATAKRLVYGLIDIEMIAGPSEILIIADGKSDPRHVAADMLSQAEHDTEASAVLVTDSEKLALAVQAELEKQIPLLTRAGIARASIDFNGRIILVDTLTEAAKISNEIAPEHLELCVEEPFELLEKITNAGSVFLGRFTPEPLGDYWAGPNHTLPTSGTARFSSPLSVDDFVKKMSYIYYTPEALEDAGADVMRFAKSEGLTAHARSVEVRLEEKL